MIVLIPQSLAHRTAKLSRYMIDLREESEIRLVDDFRRAHLRRS